MAVEGRRWKRELVCRYFGVQPGQDQDGPGGEVGGSVESGEEELDKMLVGGDSVESPEKYDSVETLVDNEDKGSFSASVEKPRANCEADVGEVNNDIVMSLQEDTVDESDVETCDQMEIVDDAAVVEDDEAPESELEIDKDTDPTENRVTTKVECSVTRNIEIVDISTDQEEEMNMVDEDSNDDSGRKAIQLSSGDDRTRLRCQDTFDMREKIGQDQAGEKDCVFVQDVQKFKLDEQEADTLMLECAEEQIDVSLETVIIEDLVEDNDNLEADFVVEQITRFIESVKIVDVENSDKDDIKANNGLKVSDKLTVLSNSEASEAVGDIIDLIVSSIAYEKVSGKGCIGAAEESLVVANEVLEPVLSSLLDSKDDTEPNLVKGDNKAEVVEPIAAPMDASKVAFHSLDIRLKIGFPPVLTKKDKLNEEKKNCVSVVLTSYRWNSLMKMLQELSRRTWTAKVKFESVSSVTDGQVRKDVVFKTESEATIFHERVSKLYLPRNIALKAFTLSETDLGLLVDPVLSEAELLFVLTKQEEGKHNLMKIFDGKVEQDREGEICFKFSSLASLNLFLYNMAGSSNTSLGLFRRNMKAVEPMDLQGSLNLSSLNLEVVHSPHPPGTPRIQSWGWNHLEKDYFFQLALTGCSKSKKILIFQSKLKLFQFWASKTGKLLNEVRVSTRVSMLEAKVSTRVSMPEAKVSTRLTLPDVKGSPRLPIVDKLDHYKKRLVKIEARTKLSEDLLNKKEIEVAKLKENQTLEKKVSARKVLELEVQIWKLQKVLIENNEVGEKLSTQIQAMEKESENEIQAITTLEEKLVMEVNDGSERKAIQMSSGEDRTRSRCPDTFEMRGNVDQDQAGENDCVFVQGVHNFKLKVLDEQEADTLMIECAEDQIDVSLETVNSKELVEDNDDLEADFMVEQITRIIESVKIIDIENSNEEINTNNGLKVSDKLTVLSNSEACEAVEDIIDLIVSSIPYEIVSGKGCIDAAEESPAVVNEVLEPVLNFLLESKDDTKPNLVKGDNKVEAVEPIAGPMAASKVTFYSVDRWKRELVCRYFGVQPGQDQDGPGVEVGGSVESGEEGLDKMVVGGEDTGGGDSGASGEKNDGVDTLVDNEDEGSFSASVEEPRTADEANEGEIVDVAVKSRRKSESQESDKATNEVAKITLAKEIDALARGEDYGVKEHRSIMDGSANNGSAMPRDVAPSISLKNVLSLSWKNDDANGRHYMARLGVFLKHISRLSDYESVADVDGEIFFKFSSPEVLNKILFNHCTEDCWDWTSLDQLEQKAKFKPHDIFHDFSLSIQCLQDKLHLQSGNQLAAELRQGGGQPKIKFTDSGLIARFSSLLSFLRAVTNSKLNKHHLVLLMKNNLDLIGRYTGEYNFYKGKVCLTELNLLSIHWLGEEEEEGFAECTSHFLKDSKIKEVHMDRNFRLLMTFHSLSDLNSSLDDYCQPSCNTLAKLVNLPLRCKLRPRNSFYSLLCPSTAVKKDFLAYKEFCILEIQPKQISSKSKLSLVEILRDPEVGRKYPDIHFTEKNFFFKFKSDRSLPRTAPSASVHEDQDHYQHHLEAGPDDPADDVPPPPDDQREVTSDYEESILSEPAGGGEGRLQF